MTGAVALLFGIALSLIFGNPWPDLARRWSKTFLSAAIVGLGAGTNLFVVLKAGASGVVITAIGIVAILGAALILGRLLKIERILSLLIGVGTAICGGSAIAAAAGALKSKPHDTSMALAIVFLLNAVGLFVFPWLGHALNLSQDQFGLWAALAIHDTGSVVGAAAQYGDRALEIGTTVKLTRALWIIPVTLLISRFARGDERGGARPPFPWFILGFLATSALVTAVPALSEIGHAVEAAARFMLAAALFLIGTGLTRESLRKLGARPVIHGVVLWILTSTVSLFAVQSV